MLQRRPLYELGRPDPMYHNSIYRIYRVRLMRRDLAGTFTFYTPQYIHTHPYKYVCMSRRVSFRLATAVRAATQRANDIGS
jgi:hypothetical protein